MRLKKKSPSKKKHADIKATEMIPQRTSEWVSYFWGAIGMDQSTRRVENEPIKVSNPENIASIPNSDGVKILVSNGSDSSTRICAITLARTRLITFWPNLDSGMNFLTKLWNLELNSFSCRVKHASAVFLVEPILSIVLLLSHWFWVEDNLIPRSDDNHMLDSSPEEGIPLLFVMKTIWVEFQDWRSPRFFHFS